ncbi:Na+/H+ antiporter NhaC family protein [Thermosediminibacter oceani]|uniref:Methionine transporter, NhaC family (TC 2.A.35.1.-) n=1 Tax=Thermosediminibacter oceani (strain ATCC BAA-1034 / DSM 16646 / JW/IW-1228P) TaxID=555079 RepID=D9RY76_THEOJ|nr:Na+/H+ antiporter NhaC family protein [Thermosediminibacter oceani]ADL08300.1 putative methionine transporter, NhaC family (TC 2.A.35.1.-) [Thermosediminibacter oceani DSM 16646]
MKSGKNPLALLPLAVFLALFLGSGIYFNSKGVEFAFYQLPSPVAAVAGITVAFILFKGSLDEKMESFISGVGDSNIIIMCMIYLLAGAFSTVANAMGGVDSTVNFGLSVIPPNMILPGLFIISAFVSTAMGTSMGTIAAVCPIAVDMALKAQIPLAVAVGTVVGGAMFGDNLSMISDTTIAATRTQGCAMKDKFIMNFKIALPAALITIALLAFTGITGQIPQGLEYNFIKILPYVSVLVLALMGMNVFLVLLIGIILAGAIGLADGSFTLISFTQKMYEGFGTMQEIFILSLLIGGLAAMITKEGGIDYLLDFISRRIRSRKGAELGIGALVSVADICTANNTVAIVITGPMAKKMAEENGVDPRRSASMLDIFSCVWQGIIPYGAQLLLAGSIAKLSPVEIMPFLYYPYLLGFMALAAIAFGIPRAIRS